VEEALQVVSKSHQGLHKFSETSSTSMAKDQNLKLPLEGSNVQQSPEELGLQRRTCPANELQIFVPAGHTAAVQKHLIASAADSIYQL